MDGSATRRNIHVINSALEKKIDIMIFPPNSTHLTQPLDQYVFANLKNSLARLYQPPNSRAEHEFRATMATVLSDSLQDSLRRRIIVASFEESGVFPTDSTPIVDRLPIQVKGSEGLSCSLAAFTDRIHFVGGNIDTAPHAFLFQPDGGLREKEIDDSSLDPKTDRQVQPTFEKDPTSAGEKGMRADPPSLGWNLITAKSLLDRLITWKESLKNPGERH